MFNVSNYGIVSGRLTMEPQIYNNSDGSKKIRITVAAPNNYKMDGTRASQFLPLEGFVPAAKAKNGNGVYDLLHKGDKVTIQYSVRNNNYTAKSGAPVYGIVLQIDTVKLEESKAVTDARQKKAAKSASKKAA